MWAHKHVLKGVHIGAILRIRLNDVCGGDAALSQIVLTTCVHFHLCI